MAEYVLVMAHNAQGLPAVVGSITASGPAGSVTGEAVVGEGDVDLRFVDAAIDLLRSLPGPGQSTGRRWLEGLAGLTNGVVTLTGPWEWDAQEREVLHWAMDEVGLTARAVALIRGDRVVPCPTGDEPSR